LGQGGVGVGHGVAPDDGLDWAKPAEAIAKKTEDARRRRAFGLMRTGFMVGVKITSLTPSVIERDSS
jgi:hypothetical protein